MFKTKRTISALLVAVMAAVGSNTISSREKTFGLGAGYVSHNSSALASLRFTYAFSSLIRIAPEVDCVFRNRNEDGYLFDVNVDFTHRMAGKFILYPLVGVNYSSWNTHVRNIGGSDDALIEHNSSRRHFGANVGAGVNLDVAPHLRLGARAMYTFVKKTPAARVGASISYIF